MAQSAATLKSQAEEEPPGAATRGELVELEEEPPSSRPNEVTGRNHFFKDIPAELWNDWRWQFRNRITTIEELSRLIPLSTKNKSQLKLVTTRFPLSVTPYYFSLIRSNDINDPVRQQAIPSFEEIALSDRGLEDPLEEKRDSVVQGLIHRYPDRVLMVLTNLCPMLCRHCTRKREWRHGFWIRTSAEIEAMLRYIRKNKAIRDVIISGGDPLTLSTQRLEGVISRLRQIEHVEIIRIGTRFPVVLPQRIDNELCDMLSKYSPIWLNTQFNHPQEITAESALACDRLLRCGIPVNNQSVLLKGINDSLETLMKLCHGLLKIKVRPYYLYQCDEVQGTEHFHTPVETGTRIIEGMQGHTSGLSVPTFVVDLPGGGGKVPLQPNYLLTQVDKELVLRNWEGRFFFFQNHNGSDGNGNNHSNDNLANQFFPSFIEQSEISALAAKTRDENRAGVRP